jgi:POT family proton-dependent oligopeptide transporter
MESSSSTSETEQNQHLPLLQRGSSADGIVDDNNSIKRTDVDNGCDVDVDVDVNDNNEELPNDVSRVEQLSSLPRVCLNQNPKTKKERPLRHVDENGIVSTYSLTPMTYSVIFILTVELLERFSFYGVNYTMTSFLTGAYDDRKHLYLESERWNADMSAIQASSMVSISTAVAYSMPFVGAVLADCFLGDFKAMLVGSTCFYLPGLLLILGSSIPHLWGLKTFSRKALCTGLLVLWPVGTGIVKSIVNVFGAKQFHPLLQSSLIESYYVKFYMCINIGALIGGTIVPLVAQSDVTLAYTFPVAMLLIGIVMFLSGTSRYVRTPPKGDMFNGVNVNWFRRATNKRKKGKKRSSVPVSQPSASSTDETSKVSALDTIFKISALIIPFNIAYSQMATTFIIQGTVMKRAFGWIDAASMNNADAMSVLFFGHVVGSHLYPYLNRKGIKLTTTNKFTVGSTLGALAIAWALFLEHKIHAQYELDGKKISILWQAVAYVLIGAGEIFAVSAAYEVAFKASPPEQKVLSSALNLFCVGGIPNLLCLVLYNLCRGWFMPTTGKSSKSISSLEDYVSAEVYKYFLVLFCIACLGIIVNTLPSVHNYVKTVEENATDAIKTPILRKTPLARRQLRRKLNNNSGDGKPSRYRKQTSDDYSISTATEETDEESLSLEASPLLRLQRHKAYLKYGSGPNLYKSGSMRAGPSLSSKSNQDDGVGDKKRDVTKKQNVLNKQQVDRLYRSTSSRNGNKKTATKPAPSNLIMTPDGQPLRAGKFRGKP